MNINIFQHNSNLVLRWIFSLIPEGAMVDNLTKACDTEKIIVPFRENSDLVSNIYTCKTEWETSMYRFYLNFVLITNMYSFDSYMTHELFMYLSDVVWIDKVDGPDMAAYHHINLAHVLCISILFLSVICVVWQITDTWMNLLYFTLVFSGPKLIEWLHILILLLLWLNQNLWSLFSCYKNCTYWVTHKFSIPLLYVIVL